MAVRLQCSEREDGDGEWQSEGVQLGGLGSATGVIGMWTGADHERMDPLGEQLISIPARFWTPDAVAPFCSPPRLALLPRPIRSRQVPSGHGKSDTRMSPMKAKRSNFVAVPSS